MFQLLYFRLASYGGNPAWNWMIPAKNAELLFQRGQLADILTQHPKVLLGILVLVGDNPYIERNCIQYLAFL